MAFSRSEDRGMQPVSVSYSSSTPPTSPSTCISQRTEDAVVDADGIERWLTSPAKPGSTDDLANKAINGKYVRQRLADVTARRRRQQIQQQNQPAQHEQEKETTAMLSPRSSLRQSKLLKEWKEKEQRQSCLQNSDVPNMKSSQKREAFRKTAALKSGEGGANKIYQSAIGVTATSEMNTTADVTISAVVTKNEKNSSQSEGTVGMQERIAAIRRRRQQRLQRRESEKGLKEGEKEGQQGQYTKTQKSTAVANNSEEHMDKQSHVQSLLASQSLELQPDMSIKAVQNAPRRDSIENKDDVNHNIHDRIEEEKEDSDEKDGHVFSVSRTKKIHLLKRHDAGVGGSPIVREIGNDSPVSVQNDGKHVTIHSDENSVSSIGRLRMIRRQMADGNNRRAREHKHDLKYAHEQRSHLVAANDSHFATSLPPLGRPHDEELKESKDSQNPFGQQEYEQQELQSQTNLQGIISNDDEFESTGSDDQGEHHLSDHDTESMAKSNDTVDNINNTRRIKDALARARLYRRSISERGVYHSEIGNDERKRDGESYGKRLLKNHFQSSNMVCSSIISTCTSTISVCSVESSYRSNSSRSCEDEKGDEMTTTTSTSGRTSDGEETDDEGVSQLSIATEPEAEAGLSEPPSKVSSYRGTSERISTQKAISVNHRKIMPILERDDSLISSCDKNDTAVSRNDSSIDIYSIEELVMAVGAKPDDREEEDLKGLEHASRIKLHVYDLVADDTQLDIWGCHFPLGQVFNAFNSSLHSIGTGAYHVGLEINGIEYAYGANSTKGLTGIFTCMPRCSPGYQYRTTIDFGARVVEKLLSKAKHGFKVVVDGQEIVRDMANEYLGTDYDLLRKNCCTFAHDVCIRLGIKEDEIPSWFHNLAAAGAITQDAANFTLAPITQLFAGNELDKFTDYLNKTALNDKLDAIQDGLAEDKRDHELIANTAYEY